MAWDISSSLYNTEYFNPLEDSYHFGIYFTNGGNTLFILGNNTGFIYEYNLSIPYNVGTASYSGNSFEILEDSNPYGFTMSENGLHMYVSGFVTKKVYQYDLSVAFDLSTAVVGVNIPSQTTPFALWFSPNGDYMYEGNSGNSEIIRTTLGTQFDISTKGVVITQTLLHATVIAIWFSSNGLNMYVSENTGVIHHYTLTIAWNIDSATDTGNSFASGDAVFGFWFKPNGLTFVISKGADLRGYDTEPQNKVFFSGGGGSIDSLFTKLKKDTVFTMIHSIKKPTIQYFNFVERIEQQPIQKTIRRIN